MYAFCAISACSKADKMLYLYKTGKAVLESRR